MPTKGCRVRPSHAVSEGRTEEEETGTQSGPERMAEVQVAYARNECRREGGKSDSGGGRPARLPVALELRSVVEV